MVGTPCSGQDLTSLDLTKDAHITKLEKPSQSAPEAIVERSDVMVARGDLGVELPAERRYPAASPVPQAGKPVIVATQMLESMISSPVPRAESPMSGSDLHGADA